MSSVFEAVPSERTVVHPKEKKSGEETVLRVLYAVLTANTEHIRRVNGPVGTAYDMLSAGGGCMAAATARCRSPWGKFHEHVLDLID